MLFICRRCHVLCPLMSKPVADEETVPPPAEMVAVLTERSHGTLARGSEREGKELI